MCGAGFEQRRLGYGLGEFIGRDSTRKGVVGSRCMAAGAS